MSEEYLSERDLSQWQRKKREEWLRDRKAIEEGKLRPEELSWAHVAGFGTGKIDFSEVIAAVEQEDDE